MLSGRGLCFGLITRPKESYRVCVSNECDRQAPKGEALTPHWVEEQQKKNLRDKYNLLLATKF